MARTDIQGDLTSDCDNLRRGVHTARPTNPAIGDVWISEDIKKFFVCFVTSVWTHVNPINITGASDGDYFAYDGTTGFLVPRDVTALQYGDEADRPVSPEEGDVYVATDTETVYYCFTDGEWQASYLPKGRFTEFELDGDGDITIIDTDQIFEDDGQRDLMPSLNGTADRFFEIVGGEITPKAA